MTTEETENLRRRTEEAEARASRLHGMLHDLYALQNGPPLYKYEVEWRKIMRRIEVELGIERAQAITTTSDALATGKGD